MCLSNLQIIDRTGIEFWLLQNQDTNNRKKAV